MQNPELVAFSADCADLVGLDPGECESDLFTKVMAGNAPFPASPSAWASVYGCSHAGMWFGQLGDGRAMSIAEVVPRSGERYELQLKGCGRTPFSRRFDGRAVLRSCIRCAPTSDAAYLAQHFTGLEASAAWVHEGAAEPDRERTGSSCSRRQCTHSASQPRAPCPSSALQTSSCVPGTRLPNPFAASACVGRATGLRRALTRGSGDRYQDTAAARTAEDELGELGQAGGGGSDRFPFPPNVVKEEQGAVMCRVARSFIRHVPPPRRPAAPPPRRPAAPPPRRALSTVALGRQPWRGAGSDSSSSSGGARSLSRWLRSPTTHSLASSPKPRRAAPPRAIDTVPSSAP